MRREYEELRTVCVCGLVWNSSWNAVCVVKRLQLGTKDAVSLFQDLACYFTRFAKKTFTWEDHSLYQVYINRKSFKHIWNSFLWLVWLFLLCFYCGWNHLQTEISDLSWRFKTFALKFKVDNLFHSLALFIIQAYQY